MPDSNVILAIGYKIDIEIPDESQQESPKILKSQILDILDDETFTIAAPIYKGYFYNLHENDTYKILFGYDDKGLYYFTAIVTAKGQDGDATYFTVKKISPFHKHQRRYFFRLKQAREIQYRKIEQNPQAPDQYGENPFKKGLTKDISGSGMCIVINEKINVGEKLEVIFPIEHENMVLECIVIRNDEKIYNSNTKYELGLSYENITEKDRNKIIKYIFAQHRLIIKEQKLRLAMENEQKNM